MTRARLAGWLAVGALWLAAAFLAPASAPAPERAVHLWLGPFAELAGTLEWIRFQRARIAGDRERALLAAENALFLRPRATEGWELLAAHLGLHLASQEREPDAATRRAWFEAALEVTRRGEQRAAHPARLMLYRGLLCVTKAEADPDIWPAGAAGLLDEARRAFRAAAEAGHPAAAELVDALREE